MQQSRATPPAPRAPGPGGDRAPGPRGSRLLGSLGDIVRDPLELLSGAAAAHGDVVRLGFGLPGVRRVAHLVVHPDGIRHVLQRNHRNYRKAPTYETLKDLLGEGLLTAEDAHWTRHRQLMQPAFRGERVAELAGAMVRLAEQTAERWEGLARTGEPVDVAEEMMALTLEIIATTMFGASVAEARDVVGEELTFSMEHAVRRMTWRAAPRFVPTPANLRARRAVARLNGVVHRLIARRRALPAGAAPDDLLTLLLAGAAGDGHLPDAEVRDELMTILLAGHETTANALTWTWLLLAQHPAVEGALEDELRGVLGGRSPDRDDPARLPYTRRVIDEALRLYPPAWIIEREARGDDEVLGRRIPAGTVVMVSPWVTHRSPRHWERPEVFDPERFTDARSAQRHPFVYFPFGAGPRRCIGEHFALLEARLVLATLASRFRVRPLAGHPVVPEPLVTLRPRGGLPSRLERRG